jgi:hypothetical protein
VLLSGFVISFGISMNMIKTTATFRLAPPVTGTRATAQIAITPTNTTFPQHEEQSHLI